MSLNRLFLALLFIRRYQFLSFSGSLQRSFHHLAKGSPEPRFAIFRSMFLLFVLQQTSSRRFGFRPVGRLSFKVVSSPHFAQNSWHWPTEAVPLCGDEDMFEPSGACRGRGRKGAGRSPGVGLGRGLRMSISATAVAMSPGNVLRCFSRYVACSPSLPLWTTLSSGLGNQEAGRRAGSQPLGSACRWPRESGQPRGRAPETGQSRTCVPERPETLKKKPHGIPSQTQAPAMVPPCQLLVGGRGLN